MKKKLAFLFSGILVASCMPLNLSAVAVSDDSDFHYQEEYYFDYYYNTPYSVSSDQFTYTCDGAIGIVQTDVTDANWMITGVFDYDPDKGHGAKFYTIMNLKTGERGNMYDVKTGKNADDPKYEGKYFNDISDWIDGRKLNVGDLLYVKYMTPVEIIPVEYSPTLNDDPVLLENNEENEVRYIGYGADVLGEEFTKVIRHELVTEGFEIDQATAKNNERWPEYQAYRAKKESLENLIISGDVNEDEKVGVTDVILLNKAIYNKAKISDYAVLAADTNQNSIPDAADSLNLMKQIIGLV